MAHVLDFQTSLLFFFFLSLFLWGAGYVVSKKHPDEMYLVWYIHALFLVLFTGLEIRAQLNGAELAAICGSYQGPCNSMLKSLTSFEDEAALIAIGAAVIILPQVLSYLPSGVFGCATPPLFVWTTLKLGVWSLVKFCAGFGGIVMAEPLATLILLKPVKLGAFVPGYALVTGAFGYAMILCFYEYAASWLLKKLRERRRTRAGRCLRRTQRCFTRNKPKDADLPGLIEVHVNLPQIAQVLDPDSVRIRTYFH